jgi:hypothetical protein
LAPTAVDGLRLAFTRSRPIPHARDYFPIGGDVALAFPTRREAMVSHLPMLLLMVTYTVFGLWVISLPFALT